jgi:DNA-binding NarL/FixJ family response regulator
MTSAGGILVIDTVGTAFAALRAARLGVALWRSSGRPDGTEGTGFALAVVATYERPDWSIISEFVDHVPTVIIAAHQIDDDQANHAVAIGAFGYISATLPTEAFRRAILGALNGEPAYSRRTLARGLRSVVRPQYSGKALALTPRQRQVVMLIAQGAADKEIAGALGITTATAQKHVTNLLKRLNVPNRAAAAALLVGSMLSPAPTLRVPSHVSVSPAAAAQLNQSLAPAS